MSEHDRPVRKHAAIVCGGRGTRLASAVGSLPKLLVPIDGVPLARRLLEELVRYGFTDVWLLEGYGAQAIQAALGARFGPLRLHHRVEDGPLGTAGCLTALQPDVRDDLLVLYGDVLVHMDLDRLLTFHRARDAGITLVAHPNDHPYDSDLVEVDDEDRVRRLHPKPHPPGGPDLRNLAAAALYVLSPRVLRALAPSVRQDLSQEVIPRLLVEEERIFAYCTPEYLKDMGTPARLARVEADVRAGRVEARHRSRPRPGMLLDRDGVLIHDLVAQAEPEAVALLPGAAEAVARLNEAGVLVAVVTNQPGIAKGWFTEEDHERVRRRIERELGAKGAWLDAYVYCPHHPERGHEGEVSALKVACDCRKPRPGLLLEALRALPIDRAQCWMVGDTWRDVDAARAAGIPVIGVATGDGLRSVPPDGGRRRPDAMFGSLAEAADHVLTRIGTPRGAPSTTTR